MSIVIYSSFHVNSKIQIETLKKKKNDEKLHGKIHVSSTIVPAADMYSLPQEHHLLVAMGLTATRTMKTIEHILGIFVALSCGASAYW